MRLRFLMPLVFMCSLAAGSLCGCSGSDELPAAAQSSDELVYEAFATTTILNDTSLGAMSLDDGSGKLLFATIPAQLAGVKQGTVLVAGKSASTPTGLLRMVKEVIPSGQGLTLDTVNVPLQYAFRRFHMKAKRTLSRAGSGDMTRVPLKPAASGSGNFPVSFSEPVFNPDNNLSTEADQSIASGTLSGGYDYLIGIDFDWGEVLEIPWKLIECFLGLRDECDALDLLPEFKIGAELGAKVDAKVDLKGVASLPYNKHIPIAYETLDGFFVLFLYFTPTISVSSDLSGLASSSFHIGMEGNAMANAGFSFSTRTGWHPPALTVDKNFSTTAQDVTVAADGRIALNVEVGLKLYALAGPTVGLTVYSDLSADQNRSPCWALKAGLDLTYGFEVGADFPIFGEIMLVNKNGSENIAEETLSTGTCVLPPDNKPVVPGSGPTTESYANPTFQPWARAFTGAMTGLGNSSVDGVIATKFHRGIDGHFMLSSHDASSLLKISDSGEMIWAKTYRNINPKPHEAPLLIQDTVSLGDASSLIVTYPAGLIKVGQSGGVHWAKDLPLPATTKAGPAGESRIMKTIHASAPDGQGGAWLTGAFVPDGDQASSGFLLRVSSDGAIQKALAWNHPARFVLPTVLVQTGKDVVVSGFLWESAASNAFALKVREDGSLAWARKFSAGFEPTTGIVHSSGDVVLTGAGLVVRLNDAGQVVTAFSSAPSSSISRLSLHSIAELPTTGFLVAGRYRDEYESRGVFLGQLDAAGGMLWARHYKQEKKPTDLVDYQEFPSMILQDDGGVVVACTSAIPNDSDGSYWVFKAAAKDGSIAFSDGSLSHYVPVEASAITLESQPMSVTMSTPKLLLNDKEVTVETPVLSITSQAP